MGTFIIISMIVLFGFELLGFTQSKQKNLDLRVNPAEKAIKTIKITKIKKEEEPAVKLSLEEMTSKLKYLALKSKEERNEDIINILKNGALSQVDYLIANESRTEEEVTN